MTWLHAPLLPAAVTEPPFEIVPSANIAGGGEATTSYGLTAPSSKTAGDFTTGQRRDDANSLTFTPSGADKWTKVAIAIQPNAAVVSNGQVYKFRLVRADGTPLDTYSVMPTWTIDTLAAPALVLSGGGQWSFDPAPGPSATKLYLTAAGQIVGRTSPVSGDRLLSLAGGVMQAAAPA